MPSQGDTGSVPDDPKIFHITHLDNLPGILAEGGLWSDAVRIRRRLPVVNIGHKHIKNRRLHCPVKTLHGGKLGDYVPFNFCPRSVMLYAVHRGHPDYSGGQESIVHLVSSVSRAVALGRPWAFSDRHAELAHALHYDRLSDLNQVPWQVMRRRDWRDAKEEPQAEFLVYEYFPWTAVTEVAVMTAAAEIRVRTHLSGPTPVVVRPQWYY
jgi:hypothetical protein